MIKYELVLNYVRHNRRRNPNGIYFIRRMKGEFI